MKTKLVFLLLACTLATFAQKKVDVKFDDDVTITIQEDYNDTLINGFRFIFAKTEYGSILIYKLKPDDDIQNEDALTKLYDESERSSIQNAKGKILAEELLKFKNLKSKKFSFALTKNNIDLICESLLFFFNGHLYSIKIYQAASMVKELKSQRDSLFASIQFAKKRTEEGQSLSEPKKDNIFTNKQKQGELFGRILIIGLLIFFVFRAFRKKK